MKTKVTLIIATDDEGTVSKLLEEFELLADGRATVNVVDCQEVSDDY